MHGIECLQQTKPASRFDVGYQSDKIVCFGELVEINGSNVIELDAELCDACFKVGFAIAGPSFYAFHKCDDAINHGVGVFVPVLNTCIVTEIRHKVYSFFTMKW